MLVAIPVILVKSRGCGISPTDTGREVKYPCKHDARHIRDLQEYEADNYKAEQLERVTLAAVGRGVDQRARKPPGPPSTKTVGKTNT
jgi:hypothetical protein